jgi:hypothetical protein
MSTHDEITAAIEAHRRAAAGTARRTAIRPRRRNASRTTAESRRGIVWTTADQDRIDRQAHPALRCSQVVGDRGIAFACKSSSGRAHRGSAMATLDEIQAAIEAHSRAVAAQEQAANRLCAMRLQCLDGASRSSTTSARCRMN